MNKPKLLLVDDDEALLDSFALKLSIDYDITKALSPAQAFHILETEDIFDAAVVDMWMGDDPQAGLKLIEKITASIPYPPECIVLTAYGKIENASDCMEKGAFAYVEKGRAETNKLLSQTIKRAAKHSQLNKEKQSKQLLSNMSEALIKTVESKDPFNYRHSIRITKWAMLVGLNMNLSKQKLIALEIGARLHDIGLALMPEYIITKPGKLTAKEIETFRQHPLKGYELLKDMPSINEDILEIILCHHERYNGKGYPKGLSGEDIPILAMITRVACDFDHAFSPVTNRAAREPERAIEYISRLSKEGILNPKVVSHFIQLYDDGEITRVDPLRHSDELFFLAKQEAKSHKYIETKKHCDNALNEIKRENEFYGAAFCIACGDLFYEHKQYKDASDYYKQASKLQPGFAEAFYKRGLAFEKQEMWERADWNFAVASSIMPTYIEALIARAKALLKGDFLDEAMKTFEKVLSLDPNCPECFLGKGRVFQGKASLSIDKNKTEKAQEYLITAKNNYEYALELINKIEKNLDKDETRLKEEITQAILSIETEIAV
ncbi:response regulator receiver modulated metal dependent phosphohydrolase [Candidatus Magnetoovum chiemensis]|nr:response regulator receiver modulated metal dependent phosphohydrolase [Candidatus Magnetoovum chiemensis]